jgi:hypothetical protein
VFLAYLAQASPLALAAWDSIHHVVRRASGVCLRNPHQKPSSAVCAGKLAWRLRLFFLLVVPALCEAGTELVPPPTQVTPDCYRYALDRLMQLRVLQPVILISLRLVALLRFPGPPPSRAQLRNLAGVKV